MRSLLVLTTLTLGSTAAPRAARADEVFYTTPALLQEFFKGSERVTFVRVESATARAGLADKLGYKPPKPSYVVYVARTGDAVDGYAVIDEELGQHLPITFGVKLSPAGAVERTEVMAYREAYGSEIRDARFRRQFSGKRAGDALRLGEDVVAVSGATISSRALAVGVKRAIALVEVVRGGEGALARAPSPTSAGQASGTGARSR